MLIKKNNIVRLCDVPAGSVFNFEDEYYIKTDSNVSRIYKGSSLLPDEFVCVDLEFGGIWVFNSTLEVKIIKMEGIINEND